MKHVCGLLKMAAKYKVYTHKPPFSERTKAALAAEKARGVELGKNGKVLAEKNKADADK